MVSLSYLFHILPLPYVPPIIIIIIIVIFWADESYQDVAKLFHSPVLSIALNILQITPNDGSPYPLHTTLTEVAKHSSSSPVAYTLSAVSKRVPTCSLTSRTYSMRVFHSNINGLLSANNALGKCLLTRPHLPSTRPNPRSPITTHRSYSLCLPLCKAPRLRQ